MSEAFVNVTEGAGKKLHGFDRIIGANTVIDEITLPGVPYVASYQVVTGSTSIATAAAHVLQIMAGTTLNVYVTRIKVFQSAVATASALSALDIFRLTTAGTGGGAITPLGLDTTDGASGATAMTLPTVKGTEAGSPIDRAYCYWLQTLPTAVDFAPLRAVYTYGDGTATKFLKIPAGTANGICIKNNTAVAAGTVVVVATIFEANF